ncbi:hypothetical protein NFI96_029803, partial [Prochilodus magdalenae]
LLPSRTGLASHSYREWQDREAITEPDPERKPLIPHPNPDNKPSNGTDRSPPGLSSTRTDEQALLTSILNKTAIPDW